MKAKEAREELKEILKLHKLWLEEKSGGRQANLQYADLRHADLRHANLRYADLRYADLRYANLQHADLRYAKLKGVYVSENTQGYFMRCPEVGAFTAFKKCANDSIVTLEIPGDAKRSSATGSKCRCDKARVVAIEDFNGNPIQEAVSSYDENFIYRVGETVKVDNFNADRWAECAPGIHFYITKKEAIIHNY